MQPDTRVRIKPTGKIGFTVNEENGMVCVRIPRTDGWPFPDYVYAPRNQIAIVREDKQPPTLEEALF
ncbi:hypothetical protein EB118_13605 [bacterium]|nr:hypothetical protein [bacterium]